MNYRPLFLDKKWKKSGREAQYTTPGYHKRTRIVLLNSRFCAFLVNTVEEMVRNISYVSYLSYELNHIVGN